MTTDPRFELGFDLVDDPHPPTPTTRLRASVIGEARRRRMRRVTVPASLLSVLILAMAFVGLRYARGIEDRAFDRSSKRVDFGTSENQRAMQLDQAGDAGVLSQTGTPPTSAAGAAPPGTAINATDLSPAETGRKVASSGSLTVEADDLAGTKDKAAQIVKAAGGEVYQETTSFGQSGTSVLTLKVPPEAFDDMLRQLGGLGKLAKQEIKTDDVTQQVIDLDARIRSAEASVTSVQGLVSQSKDLVQTAMLENELQRRISDLESLRAQRQNLGKRVDMSTIVVTLVSQQGTPVAEESKAPPTTKAPLGFSDGLDGGVEVAGGIARALAVTAGALVPFSPLFLLVTFAIVLRRRRRLR